MNDAENRPGQRVVSRLAQLLGVAGGMGWRRVVFARRAAAGLLVLAALVLAVRSPDATAGTAPVVVAAHPLATGSTVRPGDVRVQRWPAELVPVAAVSRRPRWRGGYWPAR